MVSAWAQSKVGTFNISNPRGEITLDVLYKLPQNRIITTGYCSWVEIHPYKKKQYQVEFSMLHRHLMFSFVYWYDRQVQYSTIITDYLYLCMELLIVSMATTYL